MEFKIALGVGYSKILFVSFKKIKRFKMKQINALC